jgi:hypothetical protein
VELLPTAAERNALRADTAALIANAGFSPYVSHSIVAPTDQFFPDTWHADDDSVARLARRVFDYAGITDIAISVDSTVEPQSKVGVWALQLDKATLELGSDHDHLKDPIAIISTFARYAAIVFRLRHDIAAETDEVENRAVDATTVYLGFGIVTTNAAYRYRASGELRGYNATTRWSHTELGNLTPQAMAYLLAMQVVARGEAPKRVAKQLEPNQASYFEAALRELDPGQVGMELGLPERSTWPPRREPPAKPTSNALALVKALRPAPGSDLPMVIAKTGAIGGHNAGRAVFRASYTRAVPFALLAFAISMVPTMALAIWGYAGAAVAVMLAISFAGIVFGHKIRRDECSGPSCSRVLAETATRCDGCGGTIAGTLLRGENRLEAEERLNVNLLPEHTE